MSEDWYDNKQLYEMLQNIKQEMTSLSKEMAETRTLIRDYNGLREKIDDTSERISKAESVITTLKWLIPALITGMGLLFTFLTYVK